MRVGTRHRRLSCDRIVDRRTSKALTRTRRVDSADSKRRSLLFVRISPRVAEGSEAVELRERGEEESVAIHQDQGFEVLAA